MSEVLTGERSATACELDPQLVEQLRVILYDVLEVEPEDLDDELPDIADKSLVTINLLVAISDDLRADVPLEALLEASTLRTLAELVAAHRPRRRARA